jgi:uracil-DNA glycosylase family 4
MGFMPTPSGTPVHGVGLIGEALGEEEEFSGRPFVGKAGRLLDRLIERLVDPDTGLPFRRDEFWVANVISCRPPENIITGAPYEEEALRRCAPYLDNHLRSEGAPKVLLALGNQALRRLTGAWGIDRLRGYYFDGPRGSTVIGTYHPSYIMRGKWNLVRVFQMDLLKAVHCAKNGRIQRKRKYVLHPSALEVAHFIGEYEKACAADPTTTLAFDIETPYGDDLEKDQEFTALEDDPSYEILRISFSFREGEAITMPWIEPYVTLAKRLLSMDRPKTTWNGANFDIPRLEANGAPVNGDHYDSMHAWHCLEPSLPMGLKYVATMYCPDMQPWALLSTKEPEFYSAADSDILLCCFNAIRARLEAQGRWTMFVRHFTQLHRVLMMMTRRGVGADAGRMKEERSNFLRKFEDEVAAIQPLISLDILPRKVYKKKDANLKPGNWIVVEQEVELKANEFVDDGWITRAHKGPSKKMGKAKRVQPPLLDAGGGLPATQGLQDPAGKKAKPRRKKEADNGGGSAPPNLEGASKR